MKEVRFFENEVGESELWNHLEMLRLSSVSNKDHRIQYNQIMFYIELLQNRGTNLPNTIVRHIEDDIYELRPGVNRVIFFYFKENVYVLLHIFRKSSQKTPFNEIAKARKRRDMYLKKERK